MESNMSSNEESFDFQIRQAFKFKEEDLNANRKGVMSRAQNIVQHTVGLYFWHLQFA
jgi:hypothetical protein